MNRRSDIPDIELVSLAVRFRMLSEQVFNAEVERYQDATASGSLLAAVVAKGLLSDAQAVSLRDALAMKQIRQQDKEFCQIALEKSYVTEGQVEECLAEQRMTFLRERRGSPVGKILVEHDYLTKSQEGELFEIQQREPLESLRKSEVTAEKGALQRDDDAIIGEEAPRLSLNIAADGLQALVTLIGQDVTEDDVERLYEQLEERGIVYGLKGREQLLTELTELATLEGDELAVVVAEGCAPTAARDERIDYFFDTDPLKVGSIREGELVDFKDRGEVPQVNEGDRLAQHHEGIPGVAGIDVYGQEVAARKPATTLMGRGKGTVLAGDGVTLLATLSGTPAVNKNGVIAVLPIFKVDGDIGYETGHVNFDGEIVVGEGIESDFEVIGGALSAKEIRAAVVHIQGNIVIDGGIIGATIVCGGTLKARYLHKANICVAGDLLVQKEIFDSDLTIGGALCADQGTLLASRVSARRGITLMDIGSDTAPPSTLIVGTDEAQQRELEQKRAEIALVDEALQLLDQGKAALDQENAAINTQIGEWAQVEDLSRVTLREKEEQLEKTLLPDTAQALGEEIEALRQRIAEAEEQLNGLFTRQDALAEEERVNDEAKQQQQMQRALFIGESQAIEQRGKDDDWDPSVRVKGTLYAATRVTGPHVTVKVNNPIRRAHIVEESHSEHGHKKWRMEIKKL